MLGALRLTRDEETVTRFRTRRVGLLLAYLALFRDRSHVRQELGELLWPEREPEVIGRNLRQALTSLRHVLEPPPMPSGTVLQVQHTALGLNREAVATDVAEFESALAEARRTADPQVRERLIRQAVALYKGELLPGFYEDWIVQERLRLEDLYVSALRRLAEAHQEAGESDEAIQAWRLAVAKEPLQEEGHLALMRLYLQSDRPASAVQQFRELQTALREELREEPGEEAKRLYAAAQAKGDNPDRGASRLSFESPASPRSEPTVRLPILLNRLRGRTEEIESALTQIDGGARLVTLLGPAGTGKTRLSVEIGRRLAEKGWSVWFVPLADLSDAAMVPDAILGAMKVSHQPGKDLTETLSEATREPVLRLLILDNLEHLLEDSIASIARIVAEVPNVRLLTTSRQALRLEAEHRIPLQPLPFPVADDSGDWTRWTESPSVQLFIDRCQTVRPDFQLTAHNAQAVADICTKLEGIPLAIELAAALSGSFAPAQMANHLETRRMTLSSRRRDLPDRHRSLHAAIEYSYVTLSPELQRLFSALSVFRGGFTVDAAAAVGSGGELSREEALDGLLELQERSLLASEPSDEGGAMRFRMLETFREYGAEQLSPEDSDLLWTAHARYMLLATSPPEGTSVEERTRHHFALEAEFENAVAALETFLAAEDPESGYRLLQHLSFAWSQRGPRAIEQRFIRQAATQAERGSLDPVSRIGLLRMLGTTHIRSLDYGAAYGVCQTALAVAQEHDLPEQIAVCYSAISTCAGYLGRLDECLELNRLALTHAPAENLALQERAYLGIGAVHWGRGETREAEAAYLSALDRSIRWRGEPDAHLLRNLARVCLDEGRHDEAMVRLGEAMRIVRRLRDDAGIGMGLSLISRYHHLRGNLGPALASGEEALAKLKAAGFSYWILLGLHQHALVLTDAGEGSTATTLFGATGEIGKSGRTLDEKDREMALAKIRRQLPEAAFERAWAKGLAMNSDEAMDLVLGRR